jgi:hypothetical protein
MLLPFTKIDSLLEFCKSNKRDASIAIKSCEVEGMLKHWVILKVTATMLIFNKITRMT